MPNRGIRLGVIALFVLAIFVGGYLYVAGGLAALPMDAVTGPNPTIAAPEKRIVPVVNIAKAIGWPAGAKPIAAPGLRVAAFANGLDHPRNLLVLPNGDVLVAEANHPSSFTSNGLRGVGENILRGRNGSAGASANRITLLRDSNGDGVVDRRSVLLGGLNSPYGMALVGSWLYVANVDAVLRFPFRPGQTEITTAPEKIAPLPGIGGHWTRNLIANADGSKLYVAVGSASNIADNGPDAEKNRAAILEIDTRTSDVRIYAWGLRNPVGMAWEPATKALWTVVNERDYLGSDLVPDYLTLVQFGGFYGWPWYYWGGYPDKRVPEPDEDMSGYVIRPDYALGPHVAALGLTFAESAKLGPKFANGAFVGLHGSWNRRPLSGYKVVFVTFAKGRPAGKPIDVLTGFLNASEQAQGRPVGVAIDKGGALLVTDDVGNRIWRVTAASYSQGVTGGTAHGPSASTVPKSAGPTISRYSMSGE